MEPDMRANASPEWHIEDTWNLCVMPLWYAHTTLLTREPHCINIKLRTRCIRLLYNIISGVCTLYTACIYNIMVLYYYSTRYGRHRDSQYNKTLKKNDYIR